MNFNFSDDQALFSESLQKYLNDNVTTKSIREFWTDNTHFLSSRWKELEELGFITANLDESNGGMSLDLITIALLVEKIGYSGMPEPIAEQLFLANPLINEFSSQINHNEYLAVAHDLAPHPNFLEDSKQLIFFQDQNPYLIDIEKLKIRSLESNDPSRSIYDFEANNLDDATKLESEKNLYEQVQNYGMVLSSALLLGLSKRIIDSAKLYTCDREQFGKPIGSFQAVKHMLADVAIEIEFTNALVYRAASSIQQNCSNATLHAAQAKFQSIKACEIASKNGLQAHGAMGYTWEMDLHIFVRKGWSYKGIWGSRPFVENLVFNNLKKDLPKLGATYTFMDNND